VRLNYNTNFSVTHYQGRDIMALWDKFESVCVGASLDGMGRRGEYLRSGQDWELVVENRKRMLQVCPRVSFLITATLSAMNAFHLPDFHQEWIEAGYVRPDGIHINILSASPREYLVQVLPIHLKRLVAEKYRDHVEKVLMPHGSSALNARAHFESAVAFMLAQDLSDELGRFRETTRRLDRLRNERFVDVFPELAELMYDQGGRSNRRST
jgi:hypothetical protein